MRSTQGSPVSLTRRMTLFMAGMLLLALCAGLAVHLLAMREALLLELQTRNREEAAGLAALLSAQGGELPALKQTLQAQQRRRTCQRLELLPADGPPAVAVGDRQAAQRAPGWFVRLLALEPAPGQAMVVVEGREMGLLTLADGAGWAHDALWDTAVFGSRMLAALALLAALVTAWVLRAWQRPLQATLDQAQALEQGRLVEAEEPGLSELRSLTRSMNTTVRRLRGVFAAQAEQVQALQRQAQVDAVTALPLRGPFVARLDSQLGEAGGPGAALILVRVLDLEGLNQRLGHEATDRLLGAAAGLLLAYVDRVPGTFAGRLNGTDFGLCLPVAGLAAETAESLHAALAAAPALHAGGARIVVGAVDGLSSMASGAALATADVALAQAESKGACVVQTQGQAPPEMLGARAWREQIGSALAEGRAELAEFVVRGRDGRLIHLECPLRVQFAAGGDFHAAARWLALARRSRLMPQVDLAALDLALVAIDGDNRPRAVHMALASLASPGFVTDVAMRLQQSGAAARALAIEWSGLSELPQYQHLLAQAAERWREHGTRLGVEVPGSEVHHISSLGEIELDYVKLEAHHLRGTASEDAVRAYAQSLVALIHGLGLMALAQGIDDAEDLATLWALGYDGATGPAVA